MGGQNRLGDHAHGKGSDAWTQQVAELGQGAHHVLAADLVKELEELLENGFHVWEDDFRHWEAKDKEEDKEDEDKCSCNCHAIGIRGLIFDFILFLQRLFGLNKKCKCGEAHY